jgi:monofunctional biosynthetic peptidoglycan transglycosylase
MWTVWIKSWIKYFSLVIMVIITALFTLLVWKYTRTTVENLEDEYITLVRDSKNVDKVHYVIQSKKPKNWVKLREISNLAKWSIIVKEDWRFYFHKGIDFNQVYVAIKEAIEGKKKIRGASTITQQLIKNVFLTSEKKLWRKIKEAILSYKIEKSVNKDKILEHYLNIIEFGEGLYGIHDAARFYFHKHPSNLSARESAFLAVLLPSPKRYAQSFRQKNLTEYMKFEMDRVLIKLRQQNIYKEEDRLLAVNSCLEWEEDCEEDTGLKAISVQTKKPGPVLKPKKNTDDEDTHTQQ